VTYTLCDRLCDVYTMWPTLWRIHYVTDFVTYTLCDRLSSIIYNSYTFTITERHLPNREPYMLKQKVIFHLNSLSFIYGLLTETNTSLDYYHYNRLYPELHTLINKQSLDCGKGLSMINVTGSPPPPHPTPPQ